MAISKPLSVTYSLLIILLMLFDILAKLLHLWKFKTPTL
jgi:NADH:ubiquinone oxidoreductase subunit 3 (subunit A)